MKEKSEKKNVCHGMSSNVTFPPFFFLASLLNDWEENEREREQGECQRWLPLAPGLASAPLCLAQGACDLLVGIRIAVRSDVTIY